MVEFGRTRRPAIHDRVLALDRRAVQRAVPGVVETVPTIRSLMIHYDPLVIDRATLIEAVRGMTGPAVPTIKPARQLDHPLLLRSGIRRGHRPDRRDQLGMTPERVVALHAGATYRVYMYGFAAGLLLPRRLPQELAVSRRASPSARRIRPARS